MKPAIKILHVEDDAVDAEIMQDALHSSSRNQRDHFDVVHVESLKDALSQIKNHGYDAVLLDLNLRDISGTDNVCAIKEENPDIPVIVLSGMDNDDVALDALDRGAQEYLIKGHCDGKVIRLAIHSSIKRKAVERRLFKQANYDSMTGLPNRGLFQEYVERMIVKAQRWDRRETVMFIDLDNFKQVNDLYGHEAGNVVLKESAARLKSTLRISDIVARYGGDEFMVLLDDQSDPNETSIAHIANKLLGAFSEPFEYEGNKITLSISIGIALYPDAGADYSALIKYADAAMYQAKQAGGGQFRVAAV